MNKPAVTVEAILNGFDDSKRLVAKLLAKENITVQFVRGAQTATFDVVRRVLTIPYWMGLTVTQLDHLIGHEVGHALFTKQSYIETLLTKYRDEATMLMRYWNVTEDAFIERKMKAQYPGFKQIFHDSYQLFHQNGPLFKGTRTHLENPNTGRMEPIASMRLIDRINLFYKIGAFIDVTFTAEEKTFIHRIDAITSTEDSFVVALDLYRYAKEQAQKQQQEQQQQSSKSSKTSDSSENGEDSNSDKSQSKKSDKKDAKKDKSEVGEGTEESEEPESKSGSKSGSEQSDENEDGNGNGNSKDEGEDSDDQNGSNGDDSSDDADSSDARGTAGANGSSDEDGTEDEGTKQSQTSKTGGIGSGVSENEIAPKTVEALDEFLKKLAAESVAQGNTRHLLISPLSDALVSECTVPAVKMMEVVETTVQTAADSVAQLDKLEQQWTNLYGSTAKLMAQEFERRKNAREMQRAQTSKTGRLDMTKLHQYRYAEDLFKRSTTVPHGQSHGIVLIVDGSSSMKNVFSNVLDQLLLFAHFAYACKIPFETYMFTDRAYRYSYGVANETKEDLTVAMPRASKLVGLINTNTDRFAFKRQFRAVLALKAAHDPDPETTYARTHSVSVDYPFMNACTRIPYSDLGGTPLYAGVLLAESHVARMKRTLNLDKMIFVVITDGADGHGLGYYDMQANNYGKIERSLQVVLPYSGMGFVVRDTVTKKNHMLVEMVHGQVTVRHNAWMRLLLSVIRDRHNAKTIYMYLSDQGYPKGIAQLSETPHLSITDAATQWTTDGQVVLPKGTSVADCGVVLAARHLSLTEQNFSDVDTDSMNAHQIVRTFTKMSRKQMSNRKFINVVIPFIA